LCVEEVDVNDDGVSEYREVGMGLGVTGLARGIAGWKERRRETERTDGLVLATNP
jgi:hypothetical protein